ncbi:unnamed protein product [Leptidea sinapis]|uniref:histone deacetylase n=1 Tax=Leptidea sinapis TaxID=189913 RepID=A0A5E4R722_9NEOP|nr:unnamed protein product [Leptidea sinapis]
MDKYHLDSTPILNQARNSGGESKIATTSIVTRNAARKAKIQTRAAAAGKARPSALIVNAKRKAQLKKRTVLETVLKDHYQIAMDSKMKVKGATGLVTDPRMLEHRCLWDDNYPENPERLKSVLRRCQELNLIDQCKAIRPRPATKEEIIKLHCSSVIDVLESTNNNNNLEYLEELSSRSYTSQSTATSTARSGPTCASPISTMWGLGEERGYQPELVLISAGYDAAFGCPEFTPELILISAGYDAAVGDEKKYWRCFNYQPSFSSDTTVKNVCDVTKVKHNVTVQYLGDETKPAKYETRNCYPVQDEGTKRLIEERLAYLESVTDLTLPQHAVGYVYDSAMLKHENICEPGHVECPDRILRMHERHREFGLLARLHIIQPMPCTDDQILRVHNEEHLKRLKNFSTMKLRDLNQKKESFDSVYFHPDSLESAAMAAGCAVQILYLSIHRYDKGAFFPQSRDADVTAVGAHTARGFNNAT